MIYHSTQSDDYFWYLILSEKQKEKTRIQSSSSVPMVGTTSRFSCYIFPTTFIKTSVVSFVKLVSFFVRVVEREL